MKSKLFFLAALLISSPMSFAEDPTKQFFANKDDSVVFKKNEISEVVLPSKEGIYVPLNETESLLTPLIQLNTQGYFSKAKEKKSKKKTIANRNKKKSYHENKHKPPIAHPAQPTAPKESNREEKDGDNKKETPAPKKEKNYEGFETEIVAAFDNTERVWDQDGRELSSEEIKQLPDFY